MAFIISQSKIQSKTISEKIFLMLFKLFQFQALSESEFPRLPEFL